jgi:hypothetical protein
LSVRTHLESVVGLMKRKNAPLRAPRGLFAARPDGYFLRAFRNTVARTPPSFPFRRLRLRSGSTAFGNLMRHRTKVAPPMFWRLLAVPRPTSDPAALLLRI